MSLTPTDLSAQRNAALQAFRDKQQAENAALQGAGSDSTPANPQDQVNLTQAQLAALAAAQAGPQPGQAPPTGAPAAGAGTAPVAGTAPIAGPGPAGGATAATPTPAPAQPPLSFDSGGAGSGLLPDPSAALPPGAGNAPAPAPTDGSGAPAPTPTTPTGAPTPVPPDNSPLQVAQQVQQLHSMWDQIRSIEAQMDIDDRKTQLDISNMYAAEWQSCMQSAQSNMLAMMAAGHGFAAAFIKNYVST